jgi:D-alanyl-D-alanine carboxypeptidase
MIRPTSAGLSYGHGGWFPGYLSDVMYLTDSKVALAVQVNSDDFRKMKGSGEQFNREIVSALFSKE